MAERMGAGLTQQKKPTRKTVLIVSGLAASVLMAACLFWRLSAPQSVEAVAYQVATDFLVKRYRAFQSSPFYLLPKEPGAVYSSSDGTGKLLVAVKGDLVEDEYGSGKPPLAFRTIVCRAMGWSPSPTIRMRGMK